MFGAWPLFPGPSCLAVHKRLLPLHPAESLAQEASAKWRCGRNELLPKVFLPTKLIMALSPRGWKRSCHCKVQVPLLNQYYHRNLQWAFIVPTLTSIFPTQPAPLWAFHSIVLTLEHWHWLWNGKSSFQRSFVPMVLYTAGFSVCYAWIALPGRN